MGFMWIPLTVGIQFLLLYALLGGPERLLACFFGQGALLDARLGKLQVGLPVALLLSFPSLAVLAAIGKWVHPVDWLDVILVQMVTLLILLRRLRHMPPVAVGGERASPLASEHHQYNGPNHKEIAPLPSAMQSPEVAILPVPAESPPLSATQTPSIPQAPLVSLAPPLPSPPPEPTTLPACPIEQKPLVPCPSIPVVSPLPPFSVAPAASERQTGRVQEPETPIQEPPPSPLQDPGTDPVRASGERQADGTSQSEVLPHPLAPRQLARELGKIYGWNRLGLERPFVEARTERQSGLGGLSPERCEAMRQVAQKTLASFRQDHGASLLSGFTSDRVLDVGEYEYDVMRRLSLSVILGYDRLYIDPYDVELCGEEITLAMYCLALRELRCQSILPMVH